VSPIRVLIADDEQLVREALTEVLDAHSLIEVVAVAVDAEEAIELAREAQPDVALVDVKMPAGGGARAARGILECSAQTRVVAFSAYDDRAIVLDMLRAGAVGYLLKGSARSEVVDAIVRSARGESVLSSEVAASVVEELTAQLQHQELEEDESRRLSARIRAVIDDRLFTLVFQPIVDLRDARTVGVEALSRFSAEPIHTPDHWFAEAERVGLRSELELATGWAAVAQMPDLREELFLSMNLSPETLPLCGHVADAAGAGRLVIEITEHAAIDDYDALTPHLASLRAGGTRVAVDDAGAGFASLRHALRLSPDFIKVDLSITRGIDADRRRYALAAGLIGFANELGAGVVAEGIETRAELDTLRELGVQYGQGFFLFAPGPLPLDDERMGHLAA
jgi:EAL domain-containing protein (putative c-di-GMP-specific phosphodiesterase class I)/AmiR/NasT family two-component response regulator